MNLNQRITACEACPRLRTHCREVARKKRKAFLDWDYWGKPVPNLGPDSARLLIVGLAPAAHGANRTGRMFTGDRSGDWLFAALHRAGFANQPTAVSQEDGLELIDCTITAMCHCAPPQNKPTKEEIVACEPFLSETIDQCQPQVLLALGGLAWKATFAECKKRDWIKPPVSKFGHGAQAELTDGRTLLGSYHPSQQNTFTGRLTEPMFDQIFSTARELLDVEREKS